MTTWTVGQVADLFGVTVRTLHHYDEIGLLVPSERSRAGYRLYTDGDLTRLAAGRRLPAARAAARRDRALLEAARARPTTCADSATRS